MKLTVAFVAVCLAFANAYPYQHIEASFEELSFDPKISKDFHQYEVFDDEHHDLIYDYTDSVTTAGYETTAVAEETTVDAEIFETTSETMTTEIDDSTTGVTEVITDRDLATTGTVYDTTQFNDDVEYTTRFDETEPTNTESSDEVKVEIS